MAENVGSSSGVEPSSEQVPDDLYYVVINISHINKDPNVLFERFRVCGVYTVLKAAKRDAHNVLIDAGLEREFFTEYETDERHYGPERELETSGRIVHAVAEDGTRFDVNIHTALNISKLKADDGERIRRELWHVLQTTVVYNGVDPFGKRHTDVEGSFASYEEAKKYALGVLLSEEDGITKESFAEYDEAGPGEPDCGYAEDVVVHAVTIHGENHLVRVLKTEGLEAVKQAYEAGKKD